MTFAQKENLLRSVLPPDNVFLSGGKLYIKDVIFLIGAAHTVSVINVSEWSRIQVIDFVRCRL